MNSNTANRSAVDFEAVLLRLLLDNAALAALVGEKVFALVIPQGTKLPCITFQRVSGNPQNCLHGHSGLEDIDLTIDVWARSYAEAKAVAKAVRAAMPPAGDPIMGDVIGFDYPAVKLIADSFGITMSRGMWDKVRAVELAMRQAAANRSQTTG